MAECPGGSHFSSLSLSSFICNVGLCEQRGLDRMASYCFRLKVKPRISRACSRAPAKSWWLAALGARGLRGLMLPFASRQAPRLSLGAFRPQGLLAGFSNTPSGLQRRASYLCPLPQTHLPRMSIWSPLDFFQAPVQMPPPRGLVYPSTS